MGDLIDIAYRFNERREKAELQRKGAYPYEDSEILFLIRDNARYTYVPCNGRYAICQVIPLDGFGDLEYIFD